MKIQHIGIPEILLTLCTLIITANAGDKMNIAYHLSWDQPNTHYYKVIVIVENPASSKTLFRIPAWRPGRYVIQNFTKNVIQFQAFNEHQQSLPIKKLDKDSWQVETNGSRQIIVNYLYYANTLDAGSTYLNDTEAFINPITILMYIPGQELQPVSLTIRKPDGWKIATALDFDQKTNCYPAPNYHELADNPILISPDFELLNFTYKNALFEIAIQGPGNYDSQKLVEDIRNIVVNQCDLFGHIPFKRYVFLYHLLHYRFGHGVEHKNSTSIILGPSKFNDGDFYLRFLSITSHEFFHLWNVERIRPESIYYPDYSRENYTATMWFFEGVTSYYGNLSMLRAGITSKARFYQNLEGVINGVKNSYGRKITSPSMASWDSWATFSSAPPHTSVSFYRSGQILGLLLDMEIRGRTRNKKSLDDVMRYLNKTYAKKNIGVPEDGIQSAVEKVAGSSFGNFFQKHVNGTHEIDYNRFLKHAGLEIVETVDDSKPKAFLGLQLKGDEKETRIRKIIPESPALLGGLDVDDILLAIDGKRVHKGNLNALLNAYQPGDKITVTVFRRDKLRNFEIVLEGGRNLKVILKEIKNPSKWQDKIRKDWLKNE